MKIPIYRILLVLLSLSAALPVAGQNPEERRTEARTALNTGVKVFKEGNSAAAVDLFTRALQLDPDFIQANLISTVTPTYPALARAARIQGVVLLQTFIDKAGSVVNLSVLSGHPLLNEAAIEAVRQWRYQPILLNGQPVDVVTTVTVNFAFQ